MPLTFQNFLAAARKVNLKAFRLFGQSADVSWIDNLSSGNTLVLFSGAIDGVNGLFGLPYVATSLQVFVNGVLQVEGIAYTLSGSSVIFSPGYVPGAGASLVIIPFGVNSNTQFTPATLSQLTVLFSSTPTFDLGLAQVLTFTLTADVTASVLTFGGGPSAPPGRQVYLRIIQDSVGGHLFAFPSNLLIDPSFVVDPVANRATILPLIYNGNTWEPFAPPFSIPAF